MGPLPATAGSVSTATIWTGDRCALRGGLGWGGEAAEECRRVQVRARASEYIACQGSRQLAPKGAPSPARPTRERRPRRRPRGGRVAGRGRKNAMPPRGVWGGTRRGPRHAPDNAHTCTHIHTAIHTHKERAPSVPGAERGCRVVGGAGPINANRGLARDRPVAGKWGRGRAEVRRAADQYVPSLAFVRL